MSLKKLFNFDYLMQNIKKSKMAVLLFLSVVPIFTSLLIITVGEDLLEGGFESLGGFNIFFMYVTPLILSLSLFGYVYKKRSADFMGSMPISRKSVYTTNTIGGIILIVLMQLITLLCTLILFGFSKGTIFPALVWDIFVYQTISYIFVFSVCNLAMSVSGNWMTQIVVVMLLFFVVPASVMFFRINHFYDTVLMDGDYQYQSTIVVHRYFNFTAPSLLVNGSYFFNALSIAKMLILSVVYFVLGYMAFLRKKLENAGESFESTNIHFFVKGLTLIPFAMILVAIIDAEAWEGVWFLVAIVAVYYLIYDMLTNKKTKFILNMGVMLISLTMLFGIYRIIAEVGENVVGSMDINDIKSYSLRGIGYTDFYLSDEEITDLDLLKKVVSDYNDNEWSSRFVEFHLNLKDGSSARLTVRNVSEKNIRELLSTIQANKLPQSGIVKSHHMIFSKQEMKEIIAEINQFIETNGVTKFYERAIDSSKDYLTFYAYDHHEVISMGIPVDLTDALFEKVTQIMNQRVYQKVSKNPYREYTLHVSSTAIENRLDGRGYFHMTAPQEIIDFILNEKGEACHDQGEYVVLQMDGEYYYTNDIDTLVKILTPYIYEDDYFMKYYDTYEDEMEYPPTKAVLDESSVEELEEGQIIEDIEDASVPVSDETLTEPVFESL